MYSAPNRKTWIGRTDVNEGDLGLRWHQVIKFVDLQDRELDELKSNEIGIVILGFQCDEGVRRNKGRIGAKQGPERLRQVCSNLASHFHQSVIIIDVGDVVCEDHDLEGAQMELQEVIYAIQQKGYFVFLLGGGHELAYPHYMGIRKSISKEKCIGIVNIDAHFDLRLPEEKASSGTPFYQIAEDCKETNQPFNYFVAGIQKAANTRALFQRAESLDVNYIYASEITESRLENNRNQLEAFMQKVDFIYLTICLDVFDIAFSPGVSAPSALGLQPNFALELIKCVVQSGKLISADIAELNPSLDQDEKTSKLASKLVFEILTAYKDYT